MFAFDTHRTASNKDKPIGGFSLWDQKEHDDKYKPVEILQSQFVAITNNDSSLGEGDYFYASGGIETVKGFSRQYSPPVLNQAKSKSAVEKIAEERVKILALKYSADDKSQEVLARLAILNQRICQRLPTVTAEQVAFLEEASEALSRVTERTDALKARLGMR